MTEQELAHALVNAGKLSRDQVVSLAAQRAGRSFAQTAVESGSVTAQEILEIDPQAFAPALQTPNPAGISSFSSPPLTTYSASSGVAPGGASSGPSPNAQINPGVLSEAWQMASSQFAVWAPATLIYIAILWGVGFVSSLLGGGRDPAHPFAMGPIVLVGQLAGQVLGAFMWAGFVKMALKQVRGVAISVGDLFSGGDVFLPVLGANLLAGLAAGIGAIFCILPGLIIAGLLLLTVPLIIDRGLGTLEAMSLSWNTLKGQAVMAALTGFVIALAACVGAIACGIGIIFTFPLLPLSMAVLYRDFFLGPVTPGQIQPQYAQPPIPSP